MNDTQILAIAIMVAALLAGTLFNNNRLTDLKELFRAELKATEASLKLSIGTLEMSVDKRFDEVDRRFDAMQASNDKAFQSIDNKLDTLLHMLADHNSRITKLEERASA